MLCCRLIDAEKEMPILFLAKIDNPLGLDAFVDYDIGNVDDRDICHG